MSPRILLFPGQGSQHPGMGAGLFERYPKETDECSEILGWSVRDLCENGPKERLNGTLHTQPCLYVVNAFSYMDYKERGEPEPSFAAGLSLGEYNALHAAGAFDLPTGLRIVKRRAELMAGMRSGGMAAVVGAAMDEIADCLREAGLSSLDIANENAFNQFVLAGPPADLERAKQAIEEKLKATVILLPVSGAFHSRYMTPVKEEFRGFLSGFAFAPLRFPVIANLSAQPYDAAAIVETLADQLTSPVRWLDSMIHVLKLDGGLDPVELGPGNTLTGLARSIQRKWRRDKISEPAAPAVASRLPGERLGASTFTSRYGLRHAYVAGAMARGISSASLVTRMAEAGMLSFLGTGGLPLADIERGLEALRPIAVRGLPWGANMLAGDREEAVADLLLRHRTPVVEAAAFVDVTAALLRYRLKGLRIENGAVVIGHRVIAKLSRPAIAERFLSPAPPHLVAALLAAGEISSLQADLAKNVPVADDICVEGNSGGHTNPGLSWLELLPLFRRLRDRMNERHGYRHPVHVGVGGGIGHPEAAAVAFLLGADFITTGSINQCSPEAGTSDLVKQMLAEADVGDTDYAPSSDMFELGAQVQVLRRGVLYPARARKLLEIYNSCDSWPDIGGTTRRQIEQAYLQTSFDNAFQQSTHRLTPDQRAEAMRNPKYRMALVFKSYCSNAVRWALEGDVAQKVNFQIWTGPAIASFNRWSRGIDLEDWRNRHVDVMADRMMAQAAEHLRDMGQRAARLSEPHGQ